MHKITSRFRNIELIDGYSVSSLYIHIKIFETFVLLEVVEIYVLDN